MQNRLFPRRFSARRVIEVALASAGALICLGVSIEVWQSIAKYQAVWPIPGLYFLETILISLAGALSIYLRKSGFLTSGSTLLTWIVAGVLIGFSVMGAFSVGLFYLPAGLAFLLAAMISARESSTSPGTGALIGIAAGAAQSALMLWVINILY
jgi:hypothetical protein